MPLSLFSDDDLSARVNILQDKNEFNIILSTEKKNYILEDTLSLDISDGASFNSVFYQGSEVYEGKNIFWGKTKIKAIVEAGQDKEFNLVLTYQICNKSHECTEAQKYEKIFKLSSATQANETSTNKTQKIEPCAKDEICSDSKEKVDIFNDRVTTLTSGDANQSNSDATQTKNEQDSIAEMLKNKNLLLTLVTFFGFGFLLAFTPCMLPVIPILSAVIISKKENISTKEGFMLSLIYVVSMSVVYALAGVIAASLGSNIQAFFQQPWIIVLFSIFFFALGLAMFGTFTIQMPKSIQSFMNSKALYGKDRTYFNVTLLGILSALIVGPCVAPPLVGALIYISQTGNEFIGGLSLFLMSFGMGVPLLLIGAGAGRFMPKPGPWMVDVKLFFGFMMIGFSIWVLSRIVDGQIILLLLGILLAAVAVFMNIFENKACSAIDSIYHLKKLIALLVLMYGIILMIGSIAGATNIKDPLEPFKAKFISDKRLLLAEFKTISTEEFDATVQKLQKPAMIVFTAQWCDNCKELDANVLGKVEVTQQLDLFELIKVDVTQVRDIDIELLKRFSLYGPPGILFYDTNKKELQNFRLSGSKDKKLFLEHIQKVKAAL
ncbi:MAG: Thiol:disulfide interchange protein DsbD [Campylobacterota bacterium]|nr:Thiol:disulfide interchange protein DsbD [Campylobacterota bacterium]